jgi:hypothetical protein
MEPDERMPRDFGPIEIDNRPCLVSMVIIFGVIIWLVVSR